MNMKKISKNPVLNLIITFFFATTMMNPHPVLANPSGAEVVNGDVTITETGSTMNVHASDRSIINWHGGLGNLAGETLNYIQPGSSAVHLSRDVSGNPSEFFGAVNANGRIFLLNANGILFGAGSQVNVGGLLASSLDISNTNFINGNYVFSANGGQPGFVQNQGTITAANGGDVSLLGGAVSNTGTIVAHLGSINLAAGTEAAMTIDGEGLVSIAVTGEVTEQMTDLEGNPIEDQVSNTGTLSADGGLVRMTGRALDSAFDSIINMEGIIEATSVSTKNGRVILDGGTDGLVLVSGSIDVSGKNEGETGGTVHVLGERVGLVGEASIDASGESGGGEVLIGGDYQGLGSVQNATITFVGEDVTINVDSIWQGDGGRVIIWADDSTFFYGTILGRGGLESGDGGFAEVSAPLHLAFDGLVDLRAPQGNKGTLLLDPDKIRIHGGTADGSDAGAGGGEENFLDVGGRVGAGVGPSTFDIWQSEIQGQSALSNIDLIAGSSIETLGTFDGGEVLLASNSNLFMGTRNNTSSGDTAGDIDLTGSDHGVDLGFRTQGTGKITIIGGRSNDATSNLILAKLTTAGGDIVIQSRTGDVTLKNTVDAGSGAVGVRSNTGKITGDAAGQDIIASELAMRAATGIGTSGDKLKTTVSKLAARNDTSGGIFVSNTGALEIGSVTATGRKPNGNPHTISQTGIRSIGDIDVSTASPLTVNENVESTGGGDITLSNGGTGFGDDIILNANVTGSAGSDITFNAADDILQNSGTVSTLGDGTLDYNAGQGNSTGEVKMATGTAATTAGGDITMDGTSVIQVSGVNAGTGDVTINTDRTVISAATDGVADIIGSTITINADEGVGEKQADVRDVEVTATTAINATSTSTSGTWGDGDIHIASIGDAPVGLVDAGDANIHFSSTGNITDANGASNNFGGADLELVSATGAGTSGDSLEAEVDLLAGTGGTGGFFVDNTGELEIGTVGSTSGITAAGDIDVSTASPLVINDDIVVTGTGSDITLGNGGTSIADDISVNANITGATDSNITFNIADDLKQNSGTISTLGAGTIDVNAGQGTSNGDVLQSAGTSISTAGGNIDIDGTGHAQINSVDAGSGTASITMSDYIRGVSNDGTADIEAATINLDAGQDIGQDGSALELTATTQINASTTNDDIYLDSIGDAPLGLIDAGTGIIELDSTGNISDANAGADNLIADSARLTAVNGIGDGDALETALAKLAAYNSSIGDINIDNTGNLLITTLDGLVGVENASGGDVDIIVHSDLTVASDGQIITDGGDITLEADGDVYVNNISTDGTFDGDGTGLTGTVEITAGGDIEDNHDENSTPIDDRFDITADTVILHATNVGTDAKAPIEMLFNDIDLDVTGDVSLFHKGAYTIDEDFDGGSFTWTNAGDLIVEGDITASTGDITLSVIDDPDLTVNSTLDAGAGDVNLSAVGFVKIDEDGEVFGNDTNITAGTDFLMEGDAKIDVTNDVDIDATDEVILEDDAEISADNDIEIDAGDDITLSDDASIQAGNDITITGLANMLMEDDAEIIGTNLTTVNITETLTMKDDSLLDPDDVSVTAKNLVMEDDATIQASNDVTVTITEKIEMEDDSKIDAGNDATVSAENIDVTDDSVIEAGNDADIDATEKLFVEDDGRIEAGRDNVIDAKNIELTDDAQVIAGRDATVTVTEDLEMDNDSLIDANNNATVNVTDKLDMEDDATITAGDKATVTAEDLEMTDDAVIEGDEAEVTIDKTLEMDDDARISANDTNATVSADEITLDDSATIEAADNVTVTATDTLTMKLASTIDGGERADVDVTNKLEMSTQAQIIAGTDADVTAGELEMENNAKIEGQDNVNVDVVGDITMNNNTSIEAINESATVEGGSLSMDDETFIKGDENVTVTVDNTLSMKDEAYIEADDNDVTANVGTLEMEEETYIEAGRDAIVTATTGNATLDDEAKIEAGRHASLIATLGDIFLNDDALIEADTDATVEATAGSITLDDDSLVDAGNDAFITAGTDLTMNTNAKVEADNNVTVDVDGNATMNDDTKIDGANIVDVTVDGELEMNDNAEIDPITVNLTLGSLDMNDDSLIQASGNITGIITNNADLSDNAKIDAGGNASLTSTTGDVTLEDNALIEADTDATVEATAGSITLDDDSLVDAGNDAFITAGTDLTMNTNAKVEADNNVTVDVDGNATMNDDTKIDGANIVDVTVDGELEMNDNAEIDPITVNLTLGSLDMNDDSLIQASGNITGIITNNADLSDNAKIDAGGNASLTSTTGDVTLEDNALIEADTDATVEATAGSITLDDDSLVDAGNDAFITAGTDLTMNTNAKVEADNNVTVDVDGNATMNDDTKIDGANIVDVTVDGELEMNDNAEIDPITVNLTLGSLDMNDASKITADQDVNLVVDLDANMSGTSSITAGTTFDADIDEGLTMSDSAAISAGTSATIDANVALGNFDLNMSGSSSISAGTDVEIDLDDLNMSDSSSITGTDNVTITGDGGGDDLTMSGSSSITATNNDVNLEFRDGTLSNTASINAGNDVIADFDRHLNMSGNGDTTGGSKIEAGNDVDLDINNQVNMSDGSLIKAGNDITMYNINNMTMNDTSKVDGVNIVDITVSGELEMNDSSAIDPVTVNLDLGQLDMNDASSITASDAVNLTVDDDANMSGSSSITAGNDVTGNIDEGLTMSGSSSITATNNNVTLDVTVDGNQNDLTMSGSSSINAGNDVEITTDETTMSGSSSINATENVTITGDHSNSDMNLSNTASINATNGNVELVNIDDLTMSGNGDTTGGSAITAGTDAILEVTGNLNMSDGSNITAGNDVSIDETDNVTMDDTSKIEATAGDVFMDINNTVTMNDDSLIKAGNDITMQDINSMTMNNSSKIDGVNIVDITVSGELEMNDSSAIDPVTVNLDLGQLDMNDASSITASEDINLTVDLDANMSGSSSITAGTTFDADIDEGLTMSDSAAISAGTSATIDANVANGNFDVNMSGSSSISAGTDVEMDFDDLNMSGSSSITGTDNVTLTGDGSGDNLTMSGSSSITATNNDVNIEVNDATMSNTSSIHAGNDVIFNIDDDLNMSGNGDTTGGSSITAGNDIDLNIDDNFNMNDGSTVNAGNDVEIDVGIDGGSAGDDMTMNDTSSIVAGHDVDILVEDDFTMNDSSKIDAVNIIDIEVDEDMVMNDSSSIDPVIVNITTDTLTMNGTSEILATTDINIDVLDGDMTMNDSSKIDADTGTVDIDVDDDFRMHDSSTIDAGTDVIADVDDDVDMDGSAAIKAGNDVDVDLDGSMTMSDSSSISAGNDVEIDVGTDGFDFFNFTDDNLTMSGSASVTAGNDATVNVGGDMTMSGSSSITADQNLSVDLVDELFDGTADGDDLTMSGSSSLNATNGNATIDVDDDLTMSGTSAITAGTDIGTNVDDNMTMNDGSKLDAGNDIDLDVGTDFGGGGDDLTMNDTSSIVAGNDIDIFVDDDMTMNGSSKIDGVNIITIDVDDNITMNDSSSIDPVTVNMTAEDLTMNDDSEILATGSINIDIEEDIEMNDNAKIDSDGTVDIDAGEGFRMHDDSRVLAGSNIDIDAADEIFMDDTALIDSDTGYVHGTAGDDITIGGIEAGSSGSDAIILTSTTGGIVDGGDTFTDLSTPGTATLIAETGIGDTDELDTAIAGLSAITETGNIDIANTGALTIVDANGVTGVSITDGADANNDHFIHITTASPFTVDAAVTNNDGGDITLLSLGSDADDDLTVNANVGTNGGDGDILLGAGDTITIDNDAIVSAVGAGTATVVAGEDFTNSETTFEQDGNTGSSGGDIIMTDGAQITTEDGIILLDAADDIALGGVSTDSTATDAVIVRARAGEVSDAGDTHADITTGDGGTTTIIAETGIGNTDAIETVTTNLAAVSNLGNIDIFNTGALTITSANGVTGVSITDSGDTDTAGFIQVLAASPMTVDEEVVNNSGGDITLAALGAAEEDDMTLNANVTVNDGPGDILIAAGDDVIFDDSVLVSTDGEGKVTVAAGEDYTDSTLDNDGNSGGDIDMGLAEVASEDGDIHIEAKNSVFLGFANADHDGDDDRGDVTVISNGPTTILDDNGDALNILAETATLVSVGNIGTELDRLEIDVRRLSATTTGGGDAFFDAIGDILIFDSSIDGDFVLDTTGSITASNVFASGDVFFTADDSIFGSNSADPADITATNITLRANTGTIGTPTIPLHVVFTDDLFFFAGGGGDSVSVNIRGNQSRTQVRFLNIPPGLVLYNGHILGGANIEFIEQAFSIMGIPDMTGLVNFATLQGRFDQSLTVFNAAALDRLREVSISFADLPETVFGLQQVGIPPVVIPEIIPPAVEERPVVLPVVEPVLPAIPLPTGINNVALELAEKLELLGADDRATITRLRDVEGLSDNDLLIETMRILENQALVSPEESIVTPTKTLPNSDFIMRLMINAQADSRAGIVQLFTIARAQPLNEFLTNNADVREILYSGLIKSLGSTQNMEESIQAALTLFETAGEDRFAQMARDERGALDQQIATTAELLRNGQAIDLIQDAQGWSVTSAGPVTAQ